MRKFYLILFIVICALPLFAGEHPRLFITANEAAQIKSDLGSYPLLDASYNKMKSEVDAAVAGEIIVPPPGEGGSYEHEKHKQNYRDMQKAGILFQITGDEKYAEFVRKMLMKYADMYPKLGPHPQAHNQAPGKLFHQMLNETVWLVYTAQAYDCIYDWLSPEDRAHFEKNIFNIIIDWFTINNAHEFDRIHNHGTWTVASIGMIGYVLDRPDLVELALYGTKKDGTGGFLRQLDLLFSPDGYYMEGPYYIRYALRPFFIFAEAIERFQPELKIYKYRDSILKKAIFSALQTTYPNGVFAPINDASRTMNVKAPGALIATDIAFQRYGADDNLLGIAGIQGNVILNGAGLTVAKAMAKAGTAPDCKWTSVEFTDGWDGKQGGLGILRYGSGQDQMMLMMKYGVHGAGHGHFDKLHFMLYDQRHEVIPDYGYSRWINVEPKFGGRYLPENKSYAMQTIAHNTVVVDQTTQNNFNRKQADKVSGLRHFFNSQNPDQQVVSARANDHYPGVDMQRTMFLIKDEKLQYPVIVDVYRLASDQQHVYDYPIHFDGQMIFSNTPFTADTAVQKIMGDNFGYQHIWQQAQGKAIENSAVTFLNGSRYYTVTTNSTPDMELLFGRTGANDPNFNLRSEPMFLLRKKADTHVFASVIEPHGFFSEAMEKSDQARPVIASVNVVADDASSTVVEVTGKNGIHWILGVNNGEASTKTSHKIKAGNRTFQWTGNYTIKLENQ